MVSKKKSRYVMIDKNAMILKLEYDQVSHNRLISILNEYAPEGLYTSLAILF